MADVLPETMRAVEWRSISGGLEKNLKLNNQAPLPKNASILSQGRTLVKVHYAAINPVDYKLPELPLIGRLVCGTPGIPSMDFSGEVVSTTRNDLRAGQACFGKTEVPAFGALAEYLVVGPEGAVPLPAGVSLQDAATIGVAGLTAFQCIEPYVKAGDKVFINGGSGGTGSFGIQIAKALACHVVTSCSGSNIDYCKSLGADQVIDYRAQDVADSLKRSGIQFDHFADFACVPKLYWNAHNYLKPDGEFINIGGEPTLANFIDMTKIFLLPKALGGGKRRYRFISLKTSASGYTTLAQWMAEGRIKPVATKVFNLQDASEAFQTLKAGGFNGKIVIKVRED